MDRRRVPTRALPAVAGVLVLGLLGGCAPRPAAVPDPAATASAVASASASASAAGVAPPPAGGRFDYQLGGAYPPAAGVAIVDRDRTDPAVPGVYSICYLNAFQTQPQEARLWTGSRAALLLRDAAGEPIQDPDWPGETVLDIRTPAKRAAIAAIVGRWIDGCARAGFRAVEPDNLDTFTRWPDLLTEADALAYSRLLVARAHADSLAVAQKNTPDLGARGRTVAGFDFAVAEECQRYAECGRYTAVYGRHVVEVEYTDTPRSAFTGACRERGDRISVLLRDREVVPRGDPAYRSAWC